MPPKERQELADIDPRGSSSLAVAWCLAVPRTTRQVRCGKRSARDSWGPRGRCRRQASTVPSRRVLKAYFCVCAVVRAAARRCVSDESATHAYVTNGGGVGPPSHPRGGGGQCGECAKIKGICTVGAEHLPPRFSLTVTALVVVAVARVPKPMNDLGKGTRRGCTVGRGARAQAVAKACNAFLLCGSGTKGH
eukprot:352598-Chlamydomonas_euryale.AAC.16